ncbi:hypothetical protein BpHYR1_046843 [Brachionus plicatilis]|uniref:Uncharacterized protein n=1 Tax=Brachionus plicatilis TaxID=10195 RepID=A0A3M7S0U3_BRAPC|nr:hypothetical protein BpHYR1_046843 [Brachionus plicatilis]
MENTEQVFEFLDNDRTSVHYNFFGIFSYVPNYGWATGLDKPVSVNNGFETDLKNRTNLTRNRFEIGLSKPY